jgi:putative inorganic carbon (HCO3(-)) transporter
MLRLFFAFLDRWHWALLALAAPFLLFPSPTRSLALLVVPGLWLVAWLAGRKPLPRTPLNATLLVMFCMVLVSMWATYDIGLSLSKISGMVLGIGVFFVFVREGRRIAGWWWCLVVFLATGVGVAALGLFGGRWIEKFNILTPVVSRIPRFLVGLPGVAEGLHPNMVAGALLWVIPLFIVISFQMLVRYKALQVAFGKARTIALVVVAVSATCFVLGVFVLTQSRGGFMGFGVGALGLVLFTLPSQWRKFYAVGLVVLIVIGGVVVSQLGVAAVSRLLLGGGVSTVDPALSLDTLEGRVELWSRAIYAIQDFPFTGMGMDTFPRVVHVLYPLFLVGPDVDVGHAHNDFLQVALDLGLPGLIGFVALYLGTCWMLRSVWSAAGIVNSEVSDQAYPIAPCYLAIGLGVGMLGYLVSSLTGCVATQPRYGTMFWMLLGLVGGLFERSQSWQMSRSGE